MQPSPRICSADPRIHRKSSLLGPAPDPHRRHLEDQVYECGFARARGVSVTGRSNGPEEVHRWVAFRQVIRPRHQNLWLVRSRHPLQHPPPDAPPPTTLARTLGTTTRTPTTAGQLRDRPLRPLPQPHAPLHLAQPPTHGAYSPPSIVTASAPPLPGLNGAGLAAAVHHRGGAPSPNLIPAQAVPVL